VAVSGWGVWSGGGEGCGGTHARGWGLCGRCVGVWQTWGVGRGGVRGPQGGNDGGCSCVLVGCCSVLGVVWCGVDCVLLGGGVCFCLGLVFCGGGRVLLRCWVFVWFFWCFCFFGYLDGIFTSGRIICHLENLPAGLDRTTCRHAVSLRHESAFELYDLIFAGSSVRSETLVRASYVKAKQRMQYHHSSVVGSYAYSYANSLRICCDSNWVRWLSQFTWATEKMSYVSTENFFFFSGALGAHVFQVRFVKHYRPTVLAVRINKEHAWNVGGCSVGSGCCFDLT